MCKYRQTDCYKHYGKYDYSRLHFSSPKLARMRAASLNQVFHFDPVPPDSRYVCVPALAEVGRPRR
jgi:hypothetical protein